MRCLNNSLHFTFNIINFDEHFYNRIKDVEKRKSTNIWIILIKDIDMILLNKNTQINSLFKNLEAVL